MRALFPFNAALCISCATLTVNGQVNGAGRGAMPVSLADSNGAAVAQIEAIPGGLRKESWIRSTEKGMKFEVYYGGSACDDISYAFEAKPDSLHVIERSGDCYRHGQIYGVKGIFEKLKSGTYTFAVIRRFEDNRMLTVFQREVAIP